MRGRKLLVICGPTGTGKTQLGVDLAGKFGGAIISADSRQVYRGLDWGTNKLGASWEEMRRWKWDEGRGMWKNGGVEVYGYDVVSPGGGFSAFELVKLAKEVAERLWKQGKLPIVVGGAGLYIRAVTCGLDVGGGGADWDLRRELARLPVRELGEKLRQLRPELWEKMNESDRKNPRRLIRKIELARGVKRERVEPIRAEVLKVGLTTEKDELFWRAEGWVEKIVAGGLMEEVERARKKGWGETELLSGIIYLPVQEFLEDRLTKEELVGRVKQEVKDYIKRQLVWFKKEPGVEWFDVGRKNWRGSIEKRVGAWYSN